MAKKQAVNWFGWGRYYVGRGMELFGLILTSWAILLYFGSAEMRTMLAMTGVGAASFVLGWLLANRHPDAEPTKRRVSTS